MNARAAVRRPAHGRSQAGTVLVTLLVFLVVLTLVAVSAMRSTTMDMQITTNAMLKTRAFENSEAARVRLVDLLDLHVFYRGWPVTVGGDVPATSDFTVPSELTVSAATRTDGTDDLFIANNVEIGDASYYDAGNADMLFGIDGNADGDTTDATDLSASVFVSRIGVVQAAGAAQGMLSGYEGFGNGTAAGGGSLYLDARSDGGSVDNARARTGGDIRIVIRD